MGELKDQADEYLSGKSSSGELRFESLYSVEDVMKNERLTYAIARDGTVWEAVWSDAGIEGWRRVNMTRFEEEYVDS